MIICPNCGVQNPDDIHICLGCAATLKGICFNCGAEILDGNAFCGKCGARYGEGAASSHTQPASSSEMNLQDRMLRDLREKMPSTLASKLTEASKSLRGQRREITVLIVEIANFSSIIKEMNTETVYLAVEEIVHMLANVVYKYEGTIEKHTINGLMALFGIPLNHENDPERAVRAAMEFQNSMQQMRDHLVARYHYDFNLQCGINTGSVIAGNLNDHKHLEYTVIGDTIHRATTLQKYADPGDILVSFGTYQRSRPTIDYQSLPALHAKGFSEPIKVFRPIGIRLIPGQVRGLPGLRIPMIGRSEQLEKLLGVLQEVITTNSSRIVLCSGEAGIGKSRLIAEFRNNLPAHSVIMVQGTCASYMRITPYRVIADILRNFLGISELDPEISQRNTLERRLEQLDLESTDILPYLMHVLGILHSDPVLQIRIKFLEPSMVRRQAHFALRKFLIAESRQSPLILVFDDLHWVDQASGEFIEYICQLLNEFPIMMIFVSRDFGKYGLAQSIHVAAAKHLNEPLDLVIQPLSEADGQLLVDQLLHQDTTSVRELKRSITTRARGNPYYTEELVRMLIDHGGLVLQDDKWHVSENAAGLVQGVPGTLADIILARFDHLPEHLRQILLRASVLGDSFSVKLLGTLITENRESLSANLIELEDRDFLVYTKYGVEDVYMFRHPILQDTINRTLLRSDLRNLHNQVAQAIESGDYWLPRERNQVLAHHLSESTQPTKAIPYLLASAQNASQNFANNLVVQLYRQVLELMEASDERVTAQEEQAQVGLAQALKFTGELEEAARLLGPIVEQVLEMPISLIKKDPTSFQNRIEALRELADIRAREGDLDYAVRLLTEGMEILKNVGRDTFPNLWQRLADRLAWVYFRQRNFDLAYNLADMALMDTQTWDTEEPVTRASLYNTIGGIYWARSRFADAIDSVEHSLEIYKNLHYNWGMANSLTNLGILYFSTEKWDRAVEYLEQADLLRREYGDDPERPINLKNLGEVLLDMGNHQQARDKFETSRQISMRLGLDNSAADAELGLCRLAIIEGNQAQARKYHESVWAVLGLSDEINDSVAHFYQLGALIDLKDNNLEKAKHSAEQALAIAKQGGMADKHVDALRILGMIDAEEGNYEQAESMLHRSIELAQELGDRFSEAKARYQQGLLFFRWSEAWQEQKETYLEQAGKSLDAALRIFEALGAKHDLQKVVDAKAAFSGLDRGDEYSIDSQELKNDIDSVRIRLHLPDGEWSQVTIFTAILLPRQDMDEEFIFEATAFFLPQIADLVRRNGGQVLRQRSGVTGIFGAPVAHEDDPDRAVETVMQITNLYNELKQHSELPVSIHIGIDMGKVVAGTVNMGPNAEFVAAGDPVQMAGFIANVCPSGRVWVSQAVRDKTSYHFEYTSVPLSLIRNLPEDTIFQLEGLRGQILPVRGLIGLKSPFIGRKKELESMKQMGKVLEGETGGLIWIEGEAGIGKSRLMQEFSKQISGQGARVLNGACVARRSEYAFSLFSDVLLQFFGIQHNFSQNQIFQQIDQKLKNLSPELLENRPYYQLLVGVQPAGELGERIFSMEPEQLRRQTFVALHRLFSELADGHPLVFVLDDLQWIDSISADLLLYLSHLVVSQRVLFICARRKNEFSPFDEILDRTRSMHPANNIQISIEPLTMDECRQLLGEFLSFADLPKTLLSLIVQQSGGNPYFIEEFVRLLLEKDYIHLVDDKLVANHTLHPDNLDVPASLESLIRARVDSLENPAKQLLQVASVIGHQFDRDILAEVSERMAVDVILTHLHTRGMLNPTPEENHWEFSHPLFEVIVYNSVLRAQRRIYHERTAVVLEKRWKGNEAKHAEDLAYHYAKAEDKEKALPYLILAGERSAARYANKAAVTFFEQATQLINDVPDVDDEARWRIIRGMGEVYQFIGNYDASLAMLESGLDLLDSALLSPAQRAGILRRMGDTAHKKADQEQAIVYLEQALKVLGEPQDTEARIEAALVYARLGWCLYMQSDLEKSKEAVMKAMIYARQADSLPTLAMTENYLGGIQYRRGDLQQAMQYARTAMAHWQDVGYSWGVAAALSNLGILESVSGNWQAASNYVNRSLRMRQDMGDVDGVAITHHNLGHIARQHGDHEQAEFHYRNSLAVSKPFQMNHSVANSLIGLAHSTLHQGKYEAAFDALQEGLRLAEEINAQDVIVEAQCTVAELNLARNDFIAAEKSARDAAELATQIGVSPLLATAWRLAAASLLRQGRIPNARQALEKAWQAQTDGLSEIEVGRLHAQAMQVALADHDCQDAQHHRSAAEEIFRKFGAETDLERLKAIEES